MLRRLALLWLLLVAGAAQAQTFPKFTGLVVDAADVLPQATRDDLTAKLEALQKDTGRQLVVATIPDLQGYPLEDFGYRLGRNWAVGLRDVNNGVILFVAPNEPKGHRGPRIEIGYGLEPVLTDALSSQIINQQMMPKLIGGDVPGAMEAGADAIIQQLRAHPDEAKARTDAAAASFNREHQRRSSGGGVPVSLIFWLVVLFVFVLPLFGRRRSAWGGQQSYGGGGSNWPIVLWGLSNALGGESRGGGSSWSGGGSSDNGGGGSDGSWGGGGFTGGGGGSFGGGGASGSW